MRMGAFCVTWLEVQESIGEGGGALQCKVFVAELF